MNWTPQIDRDLLIVRSLLSMLALALLTIGWRLKRQDRADYRKRERRIALVVLTGLVFASAYGFFAWRHPAGLQTHDAYHYYINAKYFPELGYFDLYECTVAALAENMGQPQEIRIRDLEAFLRRRVVDTASLGPRCNEAFSPARWQSFRADIRYFHEAFVPGQWKKVLHDMGYNPSPVWTLIGRPVATFFPAEDASMRLLARLDLGLLLVTFGFVFWAFGLELGCLVVLVWATNPLSRYIWMGDAFLRYMWFSAAIVGICLLRKEKLFGAGSLLALSSLLRLFPVLIVASLILGRLRRLQRGEGLGPGIRSLLAGALLTGLLLSLLAIPVAGRGIEVFTEFAENIGPWSRVTPSNSVGLPAMFSYTTRLPEKERVGFIMMRTQRGRQMLRDEVFASRKPLFYGASAILLFYFWTALGGKKDWEAAALGFSLILIGIDIPAYYTSFMVAPALLSQRYPGLGLLTLGAMIALCGVELIWAGEPLRWAVASPILMLVVLYTLLELRGSSAQRIGAT